jgi:hypothetical protein
MPTRFDSAPRLHTLSPRDSALRLRSADMLFDSAREHRKVEESGLPRLVHTQEHAGSNPVPCNADHAEQRARFHTAQHEGATPSIGTKEITMEPD